jgi:heterodisulfide reductase subunit A2
LILRYAGPGGQLREEHFEMVVLSVGLQPPDSARHFTRMLDLRLNEHGFCETYKFSPLQTTHSGVFVCGAFSSPKEISETIIDASGAAAEVMRLLNEQLNSYPYTPRIPLPASASDLPPERDTSGEPPAYRHLWLHLWRHHARP